MTISRRTVLTHAVAVGAMSAAGPLVAARAPVLPRNVERWGLYEIVLEGPREGNPFIDVTLAATFENEGKRIRVPGFYDGEGVFRIRFSPPDLGEWWWQVESSAPAMNGRTGTFAATAPARGNRGPVRVTKDGYHFAYADGTPFRQIGTTSYSWALQSDAKCAETLKTLAAAPFNKMRMLVFPNVESVATNPFVRTGDGPRDWDPTRFDPAYFRRYEDRIQRLGALGIEADIILFHPYDEKRGYNDMKRADDERYVRYAAARWGAYRHVWWSMANEYDNIETKTIADWDHLFETLVAADPHDRLRSIHQINIYYDHRKPWITHASVQNGAAVLDDLRAELHRAMTLKPVIFDEVVYEGNSTKRWGNLSGEDMVQRFWWGLIGGTYVGHSETYDPNRQADFSWLGQGGKLIGNSAPRLAFLRKIMEEGPAPGIEPIQPWWNYHIGGKQNDYYLKYFGAEKPTEWAVVLPGRGQEALQRYRADIIDTWNMTVTPVDGLFNMARKNDYDVHDPARPTVTLPGKPWIALRLTKAVSDTFLAVDWGTTNRRAFLIEDGAVVSTERDATGILAVPAGGFAAEVAALRARYGAVPMILAGMVGSNRGWIDAGYVACPAGLDALAAAAVMPIEGVHVVPGVSRSHEGRADVMRGEEVQLLGAVAAGMAPEDALLCQPGTHCKWATMQGGAIVDFVTAMTGEIFALLKAHALIGGAMTGDVADDAAFAQGVADAADDDLLARLFGVRPASLLGLRDDADAASYVSGLLIGSDCRARLRGGAHDVFLLADPVIGGLYATAIGASGGRAILVDSHAAFIAGIVRLREYMR